MDYQVPTLTKSKQSFICLHLKSILMYNKLKVLRKLPNNASSTLKWVYKIEKQMANRDPVFKTQNN